MKTETSLMLNALTDDNLFFLFVYANSLIQRQPNKLVCNALDKVLELNPHLENMEIAA